MKKCPFCGETIQDEAIKCKHCKKWLSTPLSKRAINMSSVHTDIQLEDNISEKTLAFVFLLFTLLLSFELFRTSSRFANMLIGGIAGVLGGGIGYAVAKGINTLDVSKRQKTIIAVVVCIIGFFVVVFIAAILKSS